LDIGIVFQHLYLWPHLSVLQNVALPLRLQGVDAREAGESAKAMLERFSLSHKTNEYPNFLSGGQQQRVALARAFVHRPRLFLLDEITTNLDEPNIEIVMRSLSSIALEGATIVMVSHRGTVPKDVEFDVLTCESGYWRPSLGL
jgi:ABC-type lipoprotein export system ATPase subunit